MLRELAFDLSLCAENGEANTESECLPLAAELLAACGAGKGVPSVRFMKGNGTKNDSRPLRGILLHRHVLLLFDYPGNDIGLVNCHMRDPVVGRVASRAELVADRVLSSSFSNDLLKRAAGVG